MNWKRQVTSAGRLLLVLGRSARRTEETGCGSSGDWQTVRARESGQYQRDRGTKGLERPTLTGQVKDWQNPNSMLGGNKSRGGKRKSELLLAGQVKEWPTPRKTDAEHGPEYPGWKSQSSSRHGKTLEGEIRQWPTPTASEQCNRNLHSAPSHGVTRGLTLAGVVGDNWPTPGASDADGGKGIRLDATETGQLPDGAKATISLRDRILRAGLHAPASRSTNGKPHGCLNSRKLIRIQGSLNSHWVAQLQGYPQNWCDVPTETP